MNRAILCMAAVTVVLSGCSDAVTTLESSAEPQLAMVPVNVSAAPAITTLSITVSAADIATDLIFNLDMSGGAASDTITIPAGSSRTVTIRGFDENGIETHRGSKTVHLTEGLNPQLTIVLLGLTGELPLLVILGETNVAVTPEAVSLSVGGTAQLEAVVTDESGDTLDVSVRWGSSNPAFVTVDEAGMVSGVGLGSASVVATYGGVGAGSAVTVIEGPANVFPTEGLVGWYPFNGNTNDESGNERHFTNEGGVFGEDRFGISGSVIEFPTLSARATREWTDFPIQTLTVATWARVGTPFSYNSYSFFMWGGVLKQGGSGLRIGVDENWYYRPCPSAGSGYTLYAGNSDGSSRLLDSDGCLTFEEVNAWHHLAIVLDSASGTARFYTDGQLSNELAYSGSFAVAGSTAFVGALDNYQSSLTTRIVDDLGIWNRALTPEEIAYLANN